MKIVTHSHFYRTLFALLSVMVLFWISAKGHETLVSDGDKTNFISQTAPSLTIAADLGQFGNKAGINAINEYPVCGWNITDASLGAFLLEIFGLLFLALVWLRLQNFASGFSILLRRSWLTISLLMSIFINSYGQCPTITPRVEFTERQHDVTYLIQVCGTITGGNQNDLDLYDPSGPTVNGRAETYVLPTGSTLQWQVSRDNGATWNDAPGPTSTTIQYVLNPIYTDFEANVGVYLFRIEVFKSGCTTLASAPISLTVSGNPSNLNPGIIAGNQSNCGSFDPVAFTATNPSGGPGSYTYQWQSSSVSDFSSNVTTITGSTNATYNPPALTQTTYYRRIVVSGGCRAFSNVITITITTATPPGAITGTTSVCPNVSGLIYSIPTIPGVTVYTWSVPTGWNLTAGQGTNMITVTSGNPGQNGNITVTVNNSCAGSNSSTLPVTVSSPVSLTVPSSIVEGCTGTLVLSRDPAYISQPVTVTLSYSGTATNGSDITSGGLPLLTSYTIPAGQSTSTINYLAVADGTPDAGEVLSIQIGQSCPCNPEPSCSTKSLTFYDPLISISATPTNETCGLLNSGSIQVTPVTGSPSILYSKDGISWQSSNIFSGLGQGLYTISAKDPASCPVTTITTTATVGASGTITANAGTDVSICSGGSVQLQGSGGTTYTWTPITGLSNPNIPNPIANPTSTTTYSLVVKTGLCISLPAQVTVTVNPSPVVAIGPSNKDICIGSGITLNAGGGSSYLWNTGSASSSITVNPVTNTTYSVSVTGAGGCVTNASANVVVHPLPTAVLNGDATTCSGDLAYLNVTRTGTGPWITVYSDGTTNFTTLPQFLYDQPISVAPSTTTTYHLISVTDFWGCVTSSVTGSATITVNPIPIAPVNAIVTPNEYCPEALINPPPLNSVTLKATGVAGTTVRWHLDSWNGILLGEVAMGDPLSVPAPNSTTTYYARTVNPCGESSAFTTATVTILPAPTVPTSINATRYAYCILNRPISFSLTPYGSQNETGYEWFKDVCGTGAPIYVSTKAVPEYTFQLADIPSVTTTYYVRAINTVTNCAPSPCYSITIPVYPVSVAGIITGTATVCSGGSPSNLTLSGYTGTIQWQSSANNVTFVDIPGAIADVLTSAQMGTLTSTTYYRAKVQSGTLNPCPADYSLPFTVTVNPLPVITLTGSSPVCLNSTGNVYTTEAGMSSYAWIVSGGTVTAGGSATSNTVTVTWDGTGPYSVSINYNNTSGCTATAAKVLPVTINPLPVFTLTGSSPVCLNSTGNVYTTEAGMPSYAWIVSGGTVTAGGTATSNTVTVTWDGTGPYSVSVNYNNTNGCTATAAKVLPVTINPLPVITLTGSSPVCLNSTGNVYTTEAGMPSYAWIVSGGTVTAGGTATSNTVTVTWDGTGPYSVSVNYNNTNECRATAAKVLPVTVSPLPVPTITGPTPVCVNSVNNTYTTEASMNNYIWAITPLGSRTISAGGGASDNTITVTWLTAGNRNVRVDYIISGGTCAGRSVTTTIVVPVNVLPAAPTGIAASPAAICVGAASTISVTDPGVGFTTDWYTVSCGGTAVPGGTGVNSLSVSPPATTTYYARTRNTSTGCLSATCASLTVTVSPPPAAPTGSTPQTFCAGNNSTIANLAATGTAIKWYAASSGGTALLSTTALVNGTHYYASQTVGVCESTSRFDVTANVVPPPALFNVTGGGIICEGVPDNIHVGLSGSEIGVNYQLYRDAIPVVLVAGTGFAIDFLTQSNGSYTVTAISAAPPNCTSSMNGSVSITPTQPIFTAYKVTVTSGGVFCAGGAGVSIGLSGSESFLSYQLFNGANPVSAVPGTGNALNFGLQTAAGIYSIVATRVNPPLCSEPMAEKVTVTVNALPQGILTANGPFCASGTGRLTWTATTGIAPYTIIYNDGTSDRTSSGVASGIPFNVATNPVTSTTTYNVISVTDANGCVRSGGFTGSSATITVNTLPQGTLSGSTICPGGTGQFTFTSSAGTGPFSLVISGVTYNGVVSGTPFNVNSNPSGTTAFTLTSITDISTCERTAGFTGASATITVNTLPQGTLSGSTICPGGVGQFTFTSTAGTGPFSLVISGVTYNGVVSGTPFNVNSNPSGTTVYTLTSITDISTCERTAGFTGASATITVNTLPQGTLSGSTICPGGAGQFTFTSTAGTGPFSLVISGVTYNGVVSGAPFNANPNPAITTSYTLTSITDNSTCERTSGFTGASATITVNALPQGSLSGSTICPGGVGQFTFTSSAGAGPFSLVISGVTYNSVVSGTPFNVNPNPSITTSYTLTSITDNSSCERTSGFTGASATITVNALSQGSLTANGPFCVTGTGQLTWSASSGTGPFTVIYNDGNANRTATNIVSGVAFNVYTTPVTSSTTYTLVSITDINGCVRNSGFTGGSVTITVNPLPNAFNVTGGGTNCASITGVPVGISGSQLGVDYQLYVGGVATGSSLAGTGSALSFGNQSAAGIYTVVAINTSTSCSQNMTGNATVTINTINPGSIVKGVVNPGPACAPLNPNTAGSLTDATGSGPISYSWEQSIDGGATWQPAAGNSTTANLSFNPDPMNVTTILHRVATSTLNGVSCSANSNDLTYVVWPLPLVERILPDVPLTINVCVNSQFTLTNATPGGVWSSANSAIATVLGGVVTGISNGSVIISYTVTDGNGCSKSVNRTVNVIALPVLSFGTSVCVGSTMNLSPSSGGIWTSSDPSKATVTASGLVTAVSAGSVTFTFTSSTAPNCSATTTTVTIYPLPTTSAIYHR